MGKRIVGSLELAVLRIVQERPRSTVQEVFEALDEKWKYTTVMTVLFRLFQKKELEREKIGKQYVYWQSKKTDKEQKTILDRLKEKIFHGKSASMAAYLIENDLTITDDELDELEALIIERKNKGT